MGSPAELTGPVNLGNPEEITIATLAEMVIDLTGSRSKIVRRPMPVDDPRQRQPDISQAKERLNWTPRTSLKDGLKRTLSYFEGLIASQGVRGMLMAERPL
jgi:UDP-glucuronate decarboxylase